MGGLGSLTPYRPYFIAFAILMLGWTFYRHFKNRVRLSWPGGAAEVLSELRPRNGKDVRLYLGVAVVIALMAFPHWGRDLFAKANNPAPASINPCASKIPGSPQNPCAQK